MVKARVLLPALVVAAALPVAGRLSPPALERQRPVFRTGARYVRVDAFRVQ